MQDILSDAATKIKRFKEQLASKQGQLNTEAQVREYTRHLGRTQEATTGISSKSCFMYAFDIRILLRSSWLSSRKPLLMMMLMLMLPSPPSPPLSPFMLVVVEACFSPFFCYRFFSVATTATTRSLEAVRKGQGFEFDACGLICNGQPRQMPETLGWFR